MQKCDTLRHSHRLSASMWRSVWPQRCNGDILVAFLCSLRCLVDWGAKLYKPIGVRFMRSNSCHKSVACMSLKHQESIRRYFTSVSHLIQQIVHPLALHLSKKIDCSTTYARYVHHQLGRISNIGRLFTIFPAFPTTLVEAMWDAWFHQSPRHPR